MLQGDYIGRPTYSKVRSSAKLIIVCYDEEEAVECSGGNRRWW